MGTRTDYLRNLDKMRSSNANAGYNIINPLENNYQVGNELSDYAYMETAKTYTPDYAKGDWGSWKRIADTVSLRSFSQNITEGVLDFADDIGDAFINVGGGIAKFFKGIGTLFTDGDFEKGWNDESLNAGIENAIKYDWTTPTANVLDKLNFGSSILSGEIGSKDYWSEWATLGDTEKTKQINDINRKSSYTQEIPYLTEIEHGIGNVLPTVALAVVTGGGSLGAQAIIQGGVAAMQSFGGGTEQALLEGKSLDSASGYGALKGVVSGAINAVSYKLGGNVASKAGTGAVGKVGSKLGTKVFEKTGSKALEVATSKLTSIAISSGGEALEEFSETLLDPVIRQATIDGNALAEAYGDNESIKKTLAGAGTAAGLAFAVSAIVQGGREGIDIASRGKAGYEANYYAEKSLSESRQLSKKITDIKSKVENGVISNEQAIIEIGKLKHLSEQIALDGNKALDSLTFVKKDNQNANYDVQEKLYYSANERMKSIRKIFPENDNVKTKTYDNGVRLIGNENLLIRYDENTDTGVAKMPNNPTRFSFNEIEGKPSIIVDPDQTKALNELISTVRDNKISVQVVDDGTVVLDSIGVEYTDLKDSSGNALTTQQNEMFKNSRARDENGNLLVVYHGTQANFTVFDPKKGFNVDAIWFSDNINVAAHWSGTTNIKKFDESALKEKLNSYKDTETNSLNNLISFIKDNFGVQYSLEKGWKDEKTNSYTYRLEIEYPNGGSVSEFLGTTKDNIHFDNGNKTTNVINKLKKEAEELIYRSVNEVGNYKVYLNIIHPLIVNANKNSYHNISFEGKKVNTEYLANYAKENGYDGVIVKNVKETDYENILTNDYIVFNSNQIKSVDNLKPTLSDDIYEKENNTINKIKNKEKASQKGITKQVNNQISTDKVYPSDLVKSKADVDKNVKYARTDSEKIVEEVVTKLNDDLGGSEYIKFKLGKENFIKNKAFNELNLRDKETAIDTIYNEIIDNGSITVDGKTYDIEFAFDDKDLKDLKTLIEDKITTIEQPTYKAKTEAEIQKINDEYNKKIAKIIERDNDIIAHLKESNKKLHKGFSKERQSLARAYNYGRALRRKFDFPEKFKFGNRTMFPEANIFRKLAMSLRLAVRKDGISPNSITAGTRLIDEYTYDKFKDSPIGYDDEIKQLNDLLKTSKYFNEDGTYKQIQVANEDVEIFAEILKLINEDVNLMTSEKTRQAIETSERANKEAKLAAKAYDLAGKKSSKEKDIWLQASGIPALTEHYFGKDSVLYKHFTEDYVEVLNNELGARQKFVELAYEKPLQNLYISKNKLLKTLSKKQTLKGIKISNDTLLDIYYMQKTTGEDFFKNGFELQINNGTTKSFKLTEEEFKTEVVDKIPSILKAWTDDVFDNLYNGTFQDYLKDNYKQRNGGLDLDVVENYYPSGREDDTVNGLDSLNKNLKVKLTSNINAVKSRVNSKNKYKITDFTTRLNKYINDITLYAERGDWIDKLWVILNTKIDGRNLNSYLKEIIPNWNKWLDYTIKVVLEQPVVKNTSAFGVIADKFLSNIHSTLLGANPGTVIRQLVSIATIIAGDETRAKEYLGGIIKSVKALSPAEWKRRTEMLEKYAPYLAKRWGSHEVLRSISGAPKLNPIVNIFGIPMELTDKFVIAGVLYDMCIDLTYKKYKTKSLNEIQLKDFGNLITLTTLETQSNADPIYMSPSRAGYHGNLVKYGFFTYAADKQNIIQFANQITINRNMAMNRIKGYEKMLEDENLSKEEKETIEEKIKQDKARYTGKAYAKKVMKVLGAIFLIGGANAAINELMDRFKGKKGWSDKLDGKDFAIDMFLETTLNWTPYLGTVTNAIANNSDVSVITIERFNKLIDNINIVQKAFETGNAKDIRKAIFTSVFNSLEMFGIPATNIYNTVMGTWRIFDPEGANATNSWTKGFSSAFMKSSISQSIADGNTKRAVNDLGSWEYLYSISQSEETNKTLIKLQAQGYNVLPLATLTYYENESGEKVYLKSSEKARFNSYYKQATKDIETLLKSDDFKNASASMKAKAIKFIYSSYYEMAKAKVLNRKPRTKMSMILSTINNRAKANKFALALAYISEIVGDDKHSKKELVLKYINSLRGLTKDEKLVLLYLANYKINDKKALVRALKNLGMTDIEMKQFFKKNKSKKK